MSNNIDVSNKIVKYLYSEYKEGKFPNTNFDKLVEIFLEGDTLESGLSRVLFHESTAKHTLTINLEEPLEEARGILLNLGIEDPALSISEVYLENPKTSSRERLTYILG